MNLEINPELKIYKLYERDGRRGFSSKSIAGNFVINKPQQTDETDCFIALVEEESKSVCYVEYKCIDSSEMGEMIKNEQKLNLVGRYINRFHIIRLNLQSNFKINELDARFSYWEGDVSFSGLNLGDVSVNFRKAEFGYGAVNFSRVVFGYTDFSWGKFW